MIFSAAEQALINAVKTNLSAYIKHKKILYDGISANCVIAGGYFASVFNDESFKDIDVFILNNSEYLLETLILNSNISSISNEWTLSKDVKYLENPHIKATAFNRITKVQFILTDYTSREELIDSFDYRHCTVSYVPRDDKLYITRSAFDCIRKKTLVENGDKKPKAWRHNKFLNRGWNYPVTVPDFYKDVLRNSYLSLKQDIITEMTEKLGASPG